MKLNLGCGNTPKPEWVNLDIQPGPGIECVFNLEECGTKQLPFPDDTFEEMSGSHLVEHIRNVMPMMQELWRVAKPGCRLTFWTPYGSSDDAWEDQTHVRPYFISSWDAFSQLYYWRADYGYRGDWKSEKLVLKLDAKVYKGLAVSKLMELIMHQRNVVLEMIVELVAIKPARKAVTGPMTEQPAIQIGLVTL